MKTNDAMIKIKEPFNPPPLSVLIATVEVSAILFHKAEFLTFRSIEKRHHQMDDLHEGRHFMRDLWNISLILTDPL